MLFRKKDSKRTDEEIIKMYRSAGDQGLIGILYERYSHLVFGVCLKYLKNREESKDAVINIFEKLLVDLKNYSIDNFKGWIHRVARNYCLMELRKNNRPGTEKDIDELYQKLEHEDPDESIMKEELLQNMEAALLELNSEQKICIELFYLQGKTYQEVCESTGYEINQVKSYIQNGKRNLKIHLTKPNEKIN